MKPINPKKKRVPLGSPIQWSEQDLAALADITPADLKAAEALWQRDAPKPLKSLLDATAMKAGDEK